jgi:hypothetical protein
MFDTIFKVDSELVRSVEWTSDPLAYDAALANLCLNQDLFLIENPYTDNLKFLHYASSTLPVTDKCIVYRYEGEWLTKIFPQGWTPDTGFFEVDLVKPTYVWIKNQHLDRLMTFENNPFGEFEPEPWDSCYTLVWYIDPLFNKEKDRVWALTCTPLGVEVKGTKEMGYVTPEIEVEINPDIEHLNLNVDDCCPSYYLLNNECICYLEPEFTEDNDQYFWMFRFRPKYRIPTKEISIGYIKPNFQIEYNPEVGELNYDLDYAITLCNFKYEHVWYLDPTITPNEEDVWAVKIYLPEIATEVKTAGYIKPTVEIESNEKFGNIEFSIDYKISWQDLKISSRNKMPKRMDGCP